MSKIIYHIEIVCEVNKHGAVIPTGSAEHITDHETKQTLNMGEYPPSSEIQIIWIGTAKQYPLIKGK